MSADTRDPPAPKRRRAQPAEEAIDRLDPPPIGLRGDFAQQVRIIPATMMNLRVAVGETANGDPVLAPFIELSMSEQSPEEEQPPRNFFNGILTMENAAFLLADLADDFLLACQHFSMIAASPIKPDQARTAIAEFYTEKAQSRLTECLALLAKAREEAKEP